MAVWTAPTTRSTGALVSASIWNTDIVENLKYLKDSPVFDGDVTIGDDLFLGSGAVINIASGDVTITHSTNTLTFAGASSGYVFNDGNATIGAAGDTAERHCQFRNNAVQFYVGVEGSSGNRFIGSAVDNAFIGTTGADGLEFATNNTVRMVLLSDGTLKTSSTVSVGNATPSTSGAGITFPASQSASSDANTLDDYEEGTFTATLKGSTTDPTTPVTTTGYYTKIGRQVSLVIAFQNIITTGAAGNVSVTGLPFAPANVQPVGAAAAQSFTTGAVTSLASTIATGSTTLSFYGTTNNSSLLDLVHSAGTSRYLFAQITYFV
jgi:hypothetical protein